MKLYHTHFCTHLISKNISYNMYKIFLYTIFCLQTHFYILYLSLFKNILLNQIIFKILFLFWPLTYAGRPRRPTDHVSGQAGRPTQSTEVLAAVRISVHVSRSTARSTEACLTVRPLLSVYFGRPGGRPRAGNDSYFCTSVDRPVDRESRLNSNG